MKLLLWLKSRPRPENIDSFFKPQTDCLKKHLELFLWTVELENETENGRKRGLEGRRGG
jgi:hypothetical protein